MTIRLLFSVGMLVTVGMLAGRVLGLLREALIAAQFGVGVDADMAVSLLIIPDFVTALLIGSAASATLVPAFASRSAQEASALFFQALAASMLLAGVAGLFIFWQVTAMQPAMRFALGMALSALPLSAANAVLVAWLQHKNRLLVPAFSNAIFNAVIVFGLWLVVSGIDTLGVAIFLAAACRLLAHVVACVKAGGLVLASGISWRLPRDVMKNYAATVSTGFFGILPQYAPYAVLAASAASIALFNYAFKLVMLPAMLLATIIQMVLLQWFVRLHQAGILQHNMPLAVQLAAVISLAVTLSVSLASQPIAQLCFAYGQMQPEDVAQVASLLSIGIWALPGMVMGAVWQQYFFAQKLTRKPLQLSAVQAVLILPASWILQEMYGLEGVIAAFVIIQWLPAVYFGIRPFVLGYAGLAMVCAVLLAYLPLAWVYGYFALSALAGLLVAVLIGAALLMAGASANRVCRQWITGRL